MAEPDEKMTCYFFADDDGEFLFTRQKVPQCDDPLIRSDVCELCGKCLYCHPQDEWCTSKTGHFWAVYVDAKYLPRDKVEDKA